MIRQKCIGCGIELQCDDKNVLGYVPEEKIISEGELLCQRCFKIKNYGQNIKNNLTTEDYKKEVNEILKKVDLVIPVFDIIDFEGSFCDEILDYLRDYRSIILVNKIDLLPDFIHPTEIANWIKDRLAEEDIVPDDISFVSAKNKYGINGVIRKINTLFPNKKIKVAIIGVSNVGKSSVINHFLGKNKITTSKYSGTTLKGISNKIPNTNITIIDTPGIISEDRVSDLLSSDTGLKLVPSGEISRKTFKMESNQIFMFDSFCTLEILENFEEYKPIFSVYSAKDVKFHVTKKDRVDDLLKGNFFEILKNEEKKKYLNEEFSEYVIEINKDEDVAIAGLGWINVKRGPLKAKIKLPKKVKAIVRPSIFKSKK